MPSRLHCTNTWQRLSAHLAPAAPHCSFFSYHFLLPIFFLRLSRVSLSPYPPAICPQVCLPCAGCCWTFSARSLFSSSPPTLLAPLVAPSCQFLSGQLTGCCWAFPATRATGKRPSVVLFDVPSPLILYTWTVQTFPEQKHQSFTSYFQSFSRPKALTPTFLHFFFVCL